MKKLLLIGLAALLLTGCAEKVVKTYKLAGEEDGFIYEVTSTVTAIKDEVIHESVKKNYTVSDFTDDEIAQYKEMLDESVACPYGAIDADGNYTIGCSKYIKINYTYDEATKTFMITEEFDFKSATKAKEDIVSEEAGGQYSENEYYSLEKFEEGYLADGYEIQE